MLYRLSYGLPKETAVHGPLTAAASAGTIGGRALLVNSCWRALGRSYTLVQIFRWRKPVRRYRGLELIRR